MPEHTITRNYSVLRGFNTGSKFVRPSNISDKAINIYRSPDGTFSPRRGYQVQTDLVGGLGLSTYENYSTNEIQPICIHTDGNLYIQKTGTMQIDFTDPSADPRSYITFEIYVDPELVSDNQTCDFDPYGVVDDRALVDDCMSFRVKQLTGVSGESIGTGSATYSGNLANVPITPGSIKFTDGTLNLLDDAVGGWYGDTGAGTNTIDYTTGAYSVTFSGATGAVTASYQTTLAEQFDLCLGKGYLESSPTSVADIETQLNALTGVSVVTTGDTSYPGAFIEIEEETIIYHGGSVTLYWYYWEAANKTVTSTFSGLAALTSSVTDFRNAVFARYEELVYISTRVDEIQKYDGQTVYRAGMPRGAQPTAANSGGGTGVDAGDHIYYATYEQTDASGRIVEGRLSLASATLTVPGGGQDVTVTVANLQAGTGWNTNGGMAAGAQGPLNTLTLDDGSGGDHTFNVGDTAYFYDSVSAGYVAREITAVTASTITVDGAAVTVADNAPFSNNLKIRIWRTEAGVTATWYLVEEIPNNSFTANSTYTDSTSDATLATQELYAIPARNPDPPPKCGVVLAYGNQMIYTQDDTNEDYVWFSEPSQPEYVPQTIATGDISNNFILPSNNDDVTAAGISGGTLIIFKEKSIHAVYGELATSQFTVQPIAPGSNIGCVTHHSVVPIGQLLYFLHTNGVYALTENQLYPTDEFGNPVPLSLPIDEVFRQDRVEIPQQFVLQRATAINYVKDYQYLLFLPAEDPSGIRYANNNSRVLCYDYLGKNWFEWTRINAAGGWYVEDDNLYWMDRTLPCEDLIAKKQKQHRKYRLIDQVDHVTPIRTTWESSWEDLGQPRVRKKFVRTALLFDEVSAVYQRNIPTLCFYSYKDWVEGRVSTRSDIMQKIQSTSWSTDAWNYVSWSGYQDSFITVALKGGTVAKSLKIGLQLNTINSTFRLQGFQQEVVSDFRKTIVR